MSFQLQTIVLGQSKRWLNLLQDVVNSTPLRMDASQEVLNEYESKSTKYFVGFVKTIFSEPLLSLEVESLLNDAIANDIFDRFCELILTSFDSQSLAEENQTLFNQDENLTVRPIVNLDRCTLHLFRFSQYASDVYENRFNDKGRISDEAKACTDESDKIKLKFTSFLQTSTDFKKPLFEMLILYTFGNFFLQPHRGTFNGSFPWQRPHDFQMLYECSESVYNYLEFRIQTQQTVHAILGRFTAYSEWFGKQRILKGLQDIENNKNTNRFEGPLHDFINEFFFLNGFFPLVNFSMGKDEPDTLSLPDRPIPIAAGLPIVIEVKQLVNPILSSGEGEKVLTSNFVTKAVNQLTDYLSRLNSATSLNVLEGAVVVFYNSKKRFSAIVPEVLLVDKYSINIRLIYLGDTTASSSSSPLKLVMANESTP